MFKNSLQKLGANAVVPAFVFAAFTLPVAGAPGAVYTMTNAADGNAVVMFSRAADGSLTGPRFFPTGGMGTGAGLGSQGALALSETGHWLIAVNAGSNDISVFSARRSGLIMTDRQPSGGAMPTSVALHGDMIFVLNAGAAPNIAGFRLTVAGKLIHISGSARDLPGQAPAQVSFVNNGATLVVTERNSNTITAYTVDDGRLSGPFTHASAGQTPFGFAVSRMDLLVVSEAAGGGAGASTVSSYEVDDSGQLRRVTSALSTGQTAACWVAVTRNGRYAFVANAASRSISSLAVARDGMLTVLNASAGQTPANAIDLAMSGNSRYLYALSRDMVSVFRVSADGSLMPVQVVSGFPTTAGGLIAR